MILVAVLGSGGLIGLLFIMLRRYLEKRLERMEKEEIGRRTARIERISIDDEMSHAIGRLLFWTYRYIMTQEHNGELDDAFQALQTAEARKKEWDRQIIAEARHDD